MTTLITLTNQTTQMAQPKTEAEKPLDLFELTGKVPAPVFRVIMNYSAEPAAIDNLTYLSEVEQEQAYKCIFDVYRDQKLMTRFCITGVSDAEDFRTKVMKVHDAVLDFTSKNSLQRTDSGETIAERVSPALDNSPALMAPVAIGNSLSGEELGDITYWKSYQDQFAQDTLMEQMVAHSLDDLADTEDFSL